MLTWSFVLQRIKEELSLPFQVLEKSDSEIIDYCKRNCVRKFSTFFPSKNKLVFDSSDPNIQVPNRISEFYMVEPDGREIFDIVDTIYTLSERLVLGHPFMGSMSYNSVPDQVLQTEQANNLWQFSIFGYTHEFSPPNIIRISPQFAGRVCVEYERMLDMELSDISPQIQDYFVDLCISSVGMNIAKIRKKFQNISTSFGEIQLDSDFLYNDSKEKYDKLIEEFETKSLTNIVFDRG